MTKRIILALFIFLSVNSFVFSNMIDQVAIVRPVLGDDAKQTYKSVANWLENSRNDKLEEQFRNKVESGGFGSGFLIEGSDDKFYIVTNFHVISEANYADVEFQDHDGKSIIYENCPVVVADENKDLAIILINQDDNDKILTGLEFNTNLQVDGTEVWTAGYPGFASEPLWQLATGTVTNQKARVKELDVNGLDYVIQHSAIIDSGSSGGPLLHKEGTGSNSRYTVVGVNTWGARGRDNTYFSIPAKDLITLVDEIPDSLDYDIESTELQIFLEEKAATFAEEITSSEEDYLTHRRFFSHEMVFDKGWKSYYAFRKSLDEKEKEEWDYYFFFGNSYEVMKKSVYGDLRSIMMSEEDNNIVKFLRIEDIENIGEKKPVPVVFSVNDEEFRTFWIIEYGQWRISQLSYEQSDIKAINTKDEDTESSGILRKIKNHNAISIAPGLTFGSFSSFPDMSNLDKGWSIGVSYETYWGNYVALTAGAGVTNFAFTQGYSTLLMDVNSKLRFQLPLSLAKGSFYLTPFVAVGAGASINFDSMVFLIPVIFSGGIEMAAGKSKDSFSWGIDVSYVKYFSIMSNSGSDAGFVIKPSAFVKWYF